MVKFFLSIIPSVIAIFIFSTSSSFSRDLIQLTIDDLKIKADKGDPDAQCALGWRYFYGQGVPIDYHEGVQWWQKSAGQGYTSAYVALGFACERGLGVKTNFSQAVTWYRKAADHKNPEGQFFLALCYASGKGVPKDIETANNLCDEAATMGLRQAQRTRGLGFYWGDIGYPKNYTNAVFWLRKAAAQGDPPANYYLGLCYESGRGTPTNFVEAVKYFRISAEAKYADALDELGQCYVYGRGLSQDFSQAAFWLKKAADEGNPEGQMHLGLLYLYGGGVEKDPIEAYKWFTLAGMKNQLTGNVGFQIMKKAGIRLNSQEVVEANRRVGLFKAMHPSNQGDFDEPNV
jgi:TPR repeat protein